MTILTSLVPDRVCKTFSLVHGALEKRAVATVLHARAETVPIASADDLEAVLRAVTESTNQTIVLAQWIDGDVPFDVITEAELARLAGQAVGEVTGGVHTISDRRVAARTKRSMISSEWLLIDADNPPGMPEDWKSLDLGQRLALLEQVLPGISFCERVELRSSSSRVSEAGAFGPRSHAYIRVNDPAKIEILRHYFDLQTVITELAFRSPRFSRSEPGKVVGHAWRSLIDTSVWVQGRLIFCAKPDVTEAPSYQVGDADIQVINPGGGPLDISWVTVPDQKVLQHYHQKTGFNLALGATGNSVHVAEHGQLTLETEITVKGETRTLKHWLDLAKVAGKLRCEAPFRESSSEAAFIGFSGDGLPFVHDVGTSTTHYLAVGAGGPSHSTMGPVTSSDRAKAIARQTLPLSGTKAETYLRAQGITCTIPQVLRFHPGLRHKSGLRLPALVAWVQGSEGYAIHRVFLAPDGPRRADLDPNEMSLGPCAGGAVRLVEADGPLVVAESIERALRLADGMIGEPASIWAALSSAGLQALKLPARPGRLIIVREAEPNSRAAAMTLADRAHVLGWEVSLLDEKVPENAGGGHQEGVK